MTSIRTALANVLPGETPDESLDIALRAIESAGQQDAGIICFPECHLPGYRIPSQPHQDHSKFLSHAWQQVDDAAARSDVAVILGTERWIDGDLRITARVTHADGSLQGFQDKVQLDPSEEFLYRPGSERSIFRCGNLTFGIVICHEGWRYPETVCWAARQGAQVVFHPHTEPAHEGQFRPSGFADPANSFHEKAALCRAAENHCFFATVNHAIPSSATTSAFVGPDGTLLSFQPHGREGLLIEDIPFGEATGFLAKRLRP